MIKLINEDFVEPQKIKEFFDSDVYNSNKNILAALIPGADLIEMNGDYSVIIDPEFIKSNSNEYFDKKLSKYKKTIDYGAGTNEYDLGNGYMITVNTTDCYDKGSEPDYIKEEDYYYGYTKDGKVCGELFGVGLVSKDIYRNNF